MGYLKSGDAHAALSAPAEAKALYAKSLELRQNLAQIDPANTDWQRGVALTQARLGRLAFKAQDFAEAARRYTAAEAISRTLAASNPDNASRQQDWAADLDSLGDVALMQGDPKRAQDFARQSYAIAASLVAADPANVESQLGLVASLVRVAIYEDDPKQFQRQALAILKNLQSRGQLDPGRAGWITTIEDQINAP